MTDRTDIAHVLNAFLDEGPDQVPDRVIEAALTEIDTIPQRRGIAVPWRFPPMPVQLKVALGAAAVLAVAVGAVFFFGRSFGPPTGGPTAVPTPTPLELPTGDLQNGAVYRAGAFGEPMTFTLPEFPDTASQPIVSDIWDAKTFRLWIQGTYAITIHDDVTLLTDWCRPERGVMTDVPSTPDEVGTWLTATTDSTLSAPTELFPDGRRALAWDLELAPGCYDSGDPPPGHSVVWLLAKDSPYRFYAVPTGGTEAEGYDDVILIITWTDRADFAAVKAATDELVSSMEFD